jgi:glyoxylase-like metal-dependent hydrolase (beta-lactamase superfamily II)
MQLREKLYFYKGIRGDKIARGVGTCNTVILGQHDLILIDPGESIKKCLRSLTTLIQKDQLDVRRIKKLLFTHVHFDHANAAAQIQAASGCEIHTHPEDVHSLEKPSTEYERMILPIMATKIYPNVPLSWARFFTDLTMGSRSPAKVSGTLCNRQIIRHENLAIDPIFTPGHAPGHIGYYIPEYKAFIAGDIIDREMDGIIDSGGCVNNMHSSWTDHLRTLEFITALDIDLYIPGHGDPIEGKSAVQAFIARNREISLKKPHRILSGLHPYGSTLRDAMRVIYPTLPFTQTLVKKIEVLLILHHLINEQKIERISTRGTARWRPVKS